LLVGRKGRHESRTRTTTDEQRDFTQATVVKLYAGFEGKII